MTRSPRLLLDRQYGGELANFELLLTQVPHVGWIEYIDSKRRTCRLKKSPFLNTFSPYRYRLPSNVHIEAGTFVEFDVGRQVIDGFTPINIKENRWESNPRYYEVESWRDVSISKYLVKPYLSESDFIGRLETSWSFGESDHLGRSFALQILGCSPNVYGSGGLGVQSLNAGSGGREVLKQLQRSVNFHLPSDFSQLNNNHQLRFVSNRTQEEEVLHTRLSQSNREISYNKLSLTDPFSPNSLQIDVPSIVSNATYRGKVGGGSYDRDTRDYILTALIYMPTNLEKFTSLIIDDMKTIRNEIMPELSGTTLNVDPYSVSRISVGITRLHLREKVDGDSLTLGRRWVKEMFKELIDLRKDIFRESGEAYAGGPVKSINIPRYAGPYDAKVVNIMYSFLNGEGLEWVSRIQIIKKCREEKIDGVDAEHALRNLIDRGYLICRMNETDFKIVNYE